MSSSSGRYGLVGVRVCFNSRNDSVSCSGKAGFEGDSSLKPSDLLCPGFHGAHHEGLQ